MRQCCCCGEKYYTNNNEMDKLVYGCRKCHRGWWQKTQEELKGIERDKKQVLSPPRRSLSPVEIAQVESSDKVATML